MFGSTNRRLSISKTRMLYNGQGLAEKYKQTVAQIVLKK